jgi:hypothetical protein
VIRRDDAVAAQTDPFDLNELLRDVDRIREPHSGGGLTVTAPRRVVLTSRGELSHRTLIHRVQA